MKSLQDTVPTEDEPGKTVHRNGYKKKRKEIGTGQPTDG